MSFDRIRGCGTALVTPFDEDSAVDEQALRALVDWQIEEGVDFLVPCGSTGEAATLSSDEHIRVVAGVAEPAVGRRPSLGGKGAARAGRCRCQASRGEIAHLCDRRVIVML